MGTTDYDRGISAFRPQFHLQREIIGKNKEGIILRATHAPHERDQRILSMCEFLKRHVTELRFIAEFYDSSKEGSVLGWAKNHSKYI